MASMLISTIVRTTGTNATQIIYGYAGETIPVGRWVYLKSSDGLYYAATPTDANTSNVVGITLNTASTGHPVAIATGGEVQVGPGTATGRTFILSASSTTMDAGDETTGQYTCLVGVGSASNKINITIASAGVAVG